MKPTEQARIAEAYCRMATSAKYRPAAPSDGCGGITASEEEMKDPKILQAESIKYAESFIAEEDSRYFWIGCSHYDCNRMLVYAVELARLSCAGPESYSHMEFLIKMIRAEMRAVTHYA